jgi:hypothetical protein
VPKLRPYSNIEYTAWAFIALPTSSNALSAADIAARMWCRRRVAIEHAAAIAAAAAAWMRCRCVAIAVALFDGWWRLRLSTFAFWPGANATTIWPCSDIKYTAWAFSAAARERSI